MRMRDPDDNGHRVRRKPRHVQPDRVDRPKPKPVTRSGDDHREPHVTRRDSVRGDEARIEGNRHRRREALDRDTDDTESNPSAAREQVSRASDASRRGTHSAPRFGSADAAEHYAQTHEPAYVGDESHHFGPDSVGESESPSAPDIDYAALYADDGSESEPGEDTPPTESNPDSNYRGNEARRYGRNLDPVSTSTSETPSVAGYGSADAAERAGQNNAPDDPNGNYRGDERRHFADGKDYVPDPLRQEEDSDIPDPPPAVAAGPPTQPPAFEGEPTTTQSDVPVSNGDGGYARGTRETYVQDGVTYTRTSVPGGNETWQYETDGVTYSGVSRTDGSTAATVSDNTDDGSFSRTVETGPGGEFLRDQTVSTTPTQSRTDTVNADLSRTTQDHIRRPDGGVADLTTTRHPDGRVDESYTYEGEQGSYARTTNTAADGTSTSTTGRSYESNIPIENFQNPPAVPEHLDGIVDLPENGRGPTTVTETQTVVTGPGGLNPQVQQSQTEYSQTSTDVEVGGWDYDSVPPGTFSEALRDGYEYGGDHSITRTVTVSTAPGEDGRPVTTTSGGQTITLSGDRSDGNGPAEATLSESWNSNGESTGTWSTSGYSNFEQSGSLGPDEVRINGETIPFTRPAGASKLPGEHLLAKGGEEVDNFLGSPVEGSVTVTRDRDGNVVSDITLLSSLDENGNGHTVTRTDTDEGPASWEYTTLSDDGRDYQRQTVLEGIPISTYETFDGSDDGTFSSTSETKYDGETVASSRTSRQIVTPEQIRTMAHHGELEPEQLARLLREGEPFVLDQTSSHTEAFNGQPEADFSSSSYATGSGYVLGLTSNVETDGSNNQTRTSFVTERKPGETPPFTGELLEERREDGAANFRETERGSLTMTPEGRVFFNGEDVTLGDPVTPPEAQEDGPDIAGYTSSVSDELAGRYQRDRIIPPTGLQKDPLTERVDHAGFRNLSRFADIVAAYGAANQVWDAVSSGELVSLDTLEGTGGLATGGVAVAGLVESYGSRAGAGARAAGLVGRAGKVSKFLAPIGSGVSGVLAVNDFVNAETGYDRVAAGLNLTAAVVSLVPGWGWAVGLGINVFAEAVARGDEKNTEGMDERLQHWQ